MEQLEDFIVQEHLKEGVLNNISRQEDGVNRAIKALQSEGLPTDIDLSFLMMLSINGSAKLRRLISVS